MDGEGNFNWRFVFPFDYLPAEQLCIIAKKVSSEICPWEMGVRDRYRDVGAARPLRGHESSSLVIHMQKLRPTEVQTLAQGHKAMTAICAVRKYPEHN